MRVLVLATVTVAMINVSAEAEKFAHVATAKPKVELSDRVKPPAPHDPIAARPVVGADAVLHIEGLVDGIRVEQEHMLLELIAGAPDSDPQKPDYYFLLGELYAKQHRTHHLLSIDAELQGRKPEATAEAKLARTALLSATRTYKALSDNDVFRNYAKMDTALFYYGYTLQTGGYVTEARAIYDRLLKDYPASKYVPEAHLAFADYYFQTGALADAESRYRKVLQFPKSSVYWYALYMLGWVQLDQKDAQGALDTFYQVVQGTLDPKQEVMHRAAKKDFVRAFAEIGKADKALAAFQRVDGKGALDMLAALSDFYIDQGKADRAIYTLRELITLQPKAARVCTWQYGVAREMMIAGKRVDQIHEIELLVKLWASLRDHKTLAAADATECRDAASEMSGQLARAYHQEAVKTQNLELFSHADRLYRAYLGAFAGAPDFAETRYFHAELLWARAELGDKNPRLHAQLWEDAAAAFTAAIDGKLDAKLTKISADAAMQAWMRALDINPLAHDAPPTEAEYATVPPPRKLPDAEQKLLAAYDLYIKHVTDPADDELVDVIFLRANLLRRFDHLPEAIAGFEDILAHHRDHDAAETAAQLALDSYNRLHRIADMIALADRLMADTAFLANKDRLRGTIQKLHRQHVRKAAEELEAEGQRSHDLAKLIACASAYLEVYNAEPLAEDADVVLYNAGICFEEGKSLGAAKMVYEQLQSLFPKSTLTARSLVRLGSLYARIAKYRDAAQTLEAYAKKYAGEHDAHDALSDAVVYRKGIGDDALAIEDTESYMRSFGTKQPAEAADAFWGLTAIYEKQGDLDKLANHLRAYLKRYGTARADRVVIAWSKLGDALWRASCPVAAVDGTCAHVTRELVGGRKIALGRSRTQTTCGDDTKVKVTIVARDPVKLAAAMTAYDRAIAEWDTRHGSVDGDERGARYYYALAKVGRTERDFETYLGMPMPTNLDFDPRKPAIATKSRKRFDDWITHKLALGKTTRTQYETVIALGDGATAIASAARLGQLTQTFAAQLFRAEIPKNLREGPYADEASQAYCDTVTERAEPFEADAVKSYEACLVTSTRLGWFSESSRLCERELGQLDPGHWPTSSELRRAPDAVSWIVAPEPPAQL